MRVEIDPRSPQAPSEQIQDQVRFAVAAGRLAPGDRLPSVRGLAAQALVNPNTVAKAYRELEREGTVETRPGDGVFIAAAAKRVCNAARTRTIGERLSRAVEDALAAGLAPDQIEGIVARCMTKSLANTTGVPRHPARGHARGAIEARAEISELRVVPGVLRPEPQASAAAARDEEEVIR